MSLLASLGVARNAPAERGAERRPPLRLVEPEAPPRRRRTGLVVTGLTAALFAALLGLAAVHTLVVQAQFHLDGLEEQLAERRDRVEQLRLRVAERESPDAIVAAAEALGMVRPAERVYLVPVPPGADPTGSTAVGGDQEPPLAATGGAVATGVGRP